MHLKATPIKMRSMLALALLAFTSATLAAPVTANGAITGATVDVAYHGNELKDQVSPRGDWDISSPLALLAFTSTDFAAPAASNETTIGATVDVAYRGNKLIDHIPPRDISWDHPGPIPGFCKVDFKEFLGLPYLIRQECDHFIEHTTWSDKKEWAYAVLPWYCTDKCDDDHPWNRDQCHNCWNAITRMHEEEHTAWMAGEVPLVCFTGTKAEKHSYRKIVGGRSYSCDEMLDFVNTGELRCDNVPSR